MTQEKKEKRLELKVKNDSKEDSELSLPAIHNERFIDCYLF